MALDKNQINLLDNLLFDQKKIDKKLYTAGPYWDYKTKKICHWIKKIGIKDFRGIRSGVGTSFADNIVVDIRNELGFKGRIIGTLTLIPLINKIFTKQINLTHNSIKSYIKYKQLFYKNSKKVNELLSKYQINNSTNFGCISKFEIDKKEYSMTYLDMCDRINNIKNFINFNDIESYLEIGGGFGVNIDILLQNFKNIKKVFYIDIVPNLFIGTEYLKKKYGSAVKDYNEIKKKDLISFENNNNLEIICIPPWKMENISSKVDTFHNSASFQEMTKDQVINYRRILKKILKKESISLIFYKGWEKNNTLSPSAVNEIFDNKLKFQEFNNLDQKNSELVYLIS